MQPRKLLEVIVCGGQRAAVFGRQCSQVRVADKVARGTCRPQHPGKHLLVRGRGSNDPHHWQRDPLIDVAKGLIQRRGTLMIRGLVENRMNSVSTTQGNATGSVPLKVLSSHSRAASCRAESLNTAYTSRFTSTSTMAEEA